LNIKAKPPNHKLSGFRDAVTAFLCCGPIVWLSFSLARVRLEPGELQFPDAAGGVYYLLL
jgi:hypothetical protein